MSRKKLLYVLLSVLVAALLMWLLLRRVDPGIVKKTLRGLSLPALGVFIVVHLVSVWLRAWRYKLLLRPLPASWAGITLATLVRNSFDDLLPARIGSLSYIYILNQRLGYSFEAAASSFIVAFVLDFLTLGPFLVLAVLAVGSGSMPFSGPALAGAALAFFAICTVAMWKLAPLVALAKKILSAGFRVFRLSDRAWVGEAVGKLDLVRDSLLKVRSPKVMVAVLVQSFGIRLAKYVSVYSLLYGFLSPHGYRLADVSFWKTIVGLTGAEFTALLPIKGLGGFGTWETAWAATFRLLGYSPDLAVVTGLGVHLSTNILEYGLGLAGLLILLVPVLRKEKNKGGH